MGKKENGEAATPATSSISTASHLMGLQLFSRAFTFLLNQALFRMVSPSVYGTANIQFELLSSTILFLSRQGVRDAMLRVKKLEPSIENVSFLPVILGVPLSIATGTAAVRWASEETKRQSGFTEAVTLYAVAAVVELVCEPMHNRAMADANTSLRVRAEGLGITLKSLATFLTLFAGGEPFALAAFGLGQLVYAGTVLLTYVAHYGPSSLRPRQPINVKENRGDMLDRSLLKLSFTMTFQSIVKHFLTEADKFFLSWFSPLQDQGGYALAVNYGSLIARIVFGPMEETLRVFFSKVLSETTSGASVKSSKTAGRLKEAQTALVSLISTQLSISLIFVVFASSYAPMLLKVLLPAPYLGTSAPKVLEAWVWYIPVLALNGGMEAFISSTSNSSDLVTQSWWMAAFSLIFIASASTLYSIGLGDSALVYANGINLSARIIYAGLFISRFFKKRGVAFQWASVLPEYSLVAVAMVSLLSVRLNGRQSGAPDLVHSRGDLFNVEVLTHIATGGALGVACLSVWWMVAGRKLLSLYRK